MKKLKINDSKQSYSTIKKVNNLKTQKNQSLSNRKDQSKLVKKPILNNNNNKNNNNNNNNKNIRNLYR